MHPWKQFVLEELQYELPNIVNDEFDDLNKQVPDVSNNYSTPQYKPAEITISWEEKEYSPSLIVPTLISGSTGSFKMIKGNK